ncbi:MAG: ROK family protein [Actinobacteria bacterium]|jgi:polyphosphate glucokinase|nr:ROK family protein [Actinomycetota bacterium]MDA2976909.1 ROK family protein [Actinomycetota bacterium]MDA2985729.1 ROK family protein [Actinomycetota bacterium]MDA8737039.1 ROK family protein [Aquiluna sp.]
MSKKAVGIDIGGTGIKGALVSTKTGELRSERIKLGTPEGGEPEAIAEVVREIAAAVDDKPERALGICFPAVVKHGITQSAANVSDRWIGLDADELFSNTLNRHVHVINDADAAGVAEVKFGAGRKRSGLTVMTTLGTGIGSALFYNGVLIPNAELGHLEIDGVDYETRASFAAMERDSLSFEEWAERLQIYYSTLEKLFTPDLFIVGGGVSKSHEQFLPLLKLKTEIVPAALQNSAGIIGAAALAYASE